MTVPKRDVASGPLHEPRTIGRTLPAGKVL
jgi:hypothetical protein